MNWDRIEGSWKQYMGKAREQWGKLTDSDWQVIKGKRDQQLRVQTLGRLGAHTVILVGLGDPDAITDAETRAFAGPV